MARYQQLPDRIDCITTTIPDAAMCQNNGMAVSCILNISAAGLRNILTVTSGCCLWTVPSSVNSIVVEAWGGGGGGGSYFECCCCAQGVGGGGGGYMSLTVATAPGCQYTLCAGTGGNYGVSNSSGATAGSASYASGYNLVGMCASGGTAGCQWACTYQWCFGMNQPTCSFGGPGSSTNFTYPVNTCGDGGRMFGRPYGCRGDNKGGAGGGPGGGLGGWSSFCSYVCSTGYPGLFPGGGGAGAMMTCNCSMCLCGQCGGGGLVRIWY